MKPELFVEVRLYNQPGIYRVLTIGGDGQKDSDMDAARILRKLAHWIETRKASRATVSNGRHYAMTELDSWIVEQHPEDQHTLMVTADKMNDALIKLDAPNEKGQP